ncbi:HAD family hydrolase [Caldinitratiruptor microaerophilus]|uniref:Haloacid dehalogenase n=1 Tax=Caldinitratiruptor microaerophilus TaxID=671077 RepID=A0AA35CKT1_9FIRM|nr:HAD-IIB family hydrolase [Caldinitratiruptor microaerophilus]BDG59140.1 haloacid dehalogenase [Caldinitratiruptor microaerophilus]
MPNPGYRLLVLDLDGTLLDARGQLPEAHRRAVQTVRRQGVEVLIATGRDWDAMLDVYRALGLSTPAITIAGAQIVDSDGRVLKEHRMHPDAVAAIESAAEAAGASLVAVQDSGLSLGTRRADDFGPWEIWNPWTRIVGEPLARHRGGKLPLFMAVYGKRSCEALLPLAPALPDTQWELWAPRDDEHVLYLWHRDANKGTALAEFCAARGYRPEEVVAMGDALLDLSMLSWAGTGVAMAAAPDEVKRVCALVTEPDDPHPVATALWRLGLTPTLEPDGRAVAGTAGPGHEGIRLGGPPGGGAKGLPEELPGGPQGGEA